MRTMIAITWLLTAVPALAQAGEPVASPPPGADRVLAAAADALKAGRTDEASRLYERATRLLPASEDAWLGLQLSHLTARRWAKAARAGRAALRLNSKSYFAQVRQGLALYMLEDYAGARRHYASALKAEPDDALAQLGMGFTLVRLGDEEAGHALCRRAGATLTGDERVAECLSAKAPRGVWGWAEASFTFLGALRSVGVDGLQTYRVQGGVEWPWKIGLRLGATLSRSQVTTMAPIGRGPGPGPGPGGGGAVTEDFDQVVAGGLVYVDHAGFKAFVGAYWHYLVDRDTSGSAILLGGLGYGGRRFGGDVTVAGSLYPSGRVVQVDPQVWWRPIAWFGVTAGASVIVDESTSDDTEVLASGRLALGFYPHRRVALTVAGFYGQERHRVEDYGLTVWSGMDRYIGGYSVGVSWSATDWLTLYGEVEHRFGDEQDGVQNDFQLIGGTLGVRASF